METTINCEITNTKFDDIINNINILNKKVDLFMKLASSFPLLLNKK